MIFLLSQCNLFTTTSSAQYTLYIYQMLAYFKKKKKYLHIHTIITHTLLYALIHPQNITANTIFLFFCTQLCIRIRYDLVKHLCMFISHTK